MPGKASLACFALSALLLALPAARAADYPTRPVTIVVAFPPGGASDVLARMIGKKLEPLLGQPVVVDNRPGAGGNVAADAVAHAAADGYTLLLGNNAIFATNAALYKKINFDPVADFAPIGLVGSQANILVVNPGVPVSSLAELIALAKENPGKLNFASSGHGLAAHLAGELFKAEAGIDIVHVPYKGAMPALQDVIAGHVQMMFATAVSVVSHIQDGTVRPLAVTTLKRTAMLPRIATMDELGLKGFDATTWHGLVAPSQTPPPVWPRSRMRFLQPWQTMASGHSSAGSGSTSSAAAPMSSPPISSRKSRNGPPSCKPPGPEWISSPDERSRLFGAIAISGTTARRPGFRDSA
jgi:tripartite-type tricarboxylate transporter receptor subunit TctC